MTVNCAMPARLPILVRQYHGQRQEPVPYITSSWEAALAGSPEEVSVLLDDRWSERAQTPDRRRVTRDHLKELLGTTHLHDPLQVRRALVMVMAWGSGTSNTRSLRNTPAALAASDCARQLRMAAERCRDGDLVHAYAKFSLPGIGRSFFTKWFAFAGLQPGRSWQPLILDDRVLATLNNSLGISLKLLAKDRRWSRRYASYVRCMHAWSAELNQMDLDCPAERLEWIMFHHKGRPVNRP
ncbi:hypothetical protein GKC29_25430 [Micromonospora sp. WMMC415]|uniref:8-oxoguanine DNA glycosylase OGG fold protein n=1 Tax=Micromonospora sp. WMMC415 TaxID=2675222 RepID=UPI0012B4DE51|nr:hypothetical protein [Micromonospora sp. WMMC415]QGN49835.1 hypothetical protein GKC29_25430 [Micromonospora sp. WMMC415]